MDSIIIGHINYINVIPVDVELVKPEYRSKKVLGVPSVLNRELLNGCVDIGFFSSVFYLRNKDRLEIAGPFCIASKREAMSVIIGSKFDLINSKKKKLKIYETPASETSIFLSRIVLKDYLGFEIEKSNRQEADIQVLIGDEALIANFNKEFSYIYDVGTLWREFTGLPAVFAVLTTRKDVPTARYDELSEYLRDLEETLIYAENHLDSIIELAKKKLELPDEYLKKYYSSLYYRMDEEAIESLKVIEEYLKKEDKYEI
ncbi:MAG: menaquinone biosynthesis protein [Actinobacteria bacterium]|nr:menaquinone biosynthesis protein [Actinomycetota bacterium]